jgi:hypothetical protein
MFFEFIPVAEYHDENPKRLSLAEVELHVDYALIINSNAGLWGYDIGDMIRFVSINPYKIIVSGRVKHYTSAFGEHVIAKEVEQALEYISNRFNLQIVDATIAPQVNPPEGGLPYHEWFIEFDSHDTIQLEVVQALEDQMKSQNIYYADLIKGNILQALKIRIMQPGAFKSFMKDAGKLGGQNKVPRLSNDRTIADKLHPYILQKL